VGIIFFFLQKSHGTRGSEMERDCFQSLFRTPAPLRVLKNSQAKRKRKTGVSMAVSYWVYNKCKRKESRKIVV
jgi:hypothetical protein